MPTKDGHQKLLKKYAEAVVKVGLNLREGQRLIITYSVSRGVSFHAAPFVHEVAKAAYAAGARYVDVIWGDEEMLRLRVEHAPRDSFTEYPSWQINGIMNMIENGDALLSISCFNPDLLNGLDTEFVSGMQKAHLQNYSPVSMAVSRNAINWCVVAASHPEWAHKI